MEERYRALLVALGKVFNDRPEFEGIKTAETAIMWQYEEYDPEGYVRQLYAMIDT